ncbi:hypothetical protein F5X96DRAFT_683867 [Biscogniauxia mediterranea]|nr:hypothetical protein F5X96DRAFT_683867 [Biscogniauxia mediterranea]
MKMHSIIIIFFIINLRLVSALPTNPVVKSIMGNVIATAHQGSTGKGVGGGSKITSGVLGPRGGSAATAGSSITIGEVMNSSPQLRPLYLALVVIACIVGVVAIAALLFKCTQCISACRKQRQGLKQQDAEKGVAQPTTVDPCVAVPEAAVTKPENHGTDNYHGV